MKKNQNLTWDDIKAMFAETERLFKEDRRQMKEVRRQMKEDRRLLKENDRKFKEENIHWKKEMKELEEKANRERAEYFKEWNEQDKKIDERFKKLEKYIGGIAHSNGELAEEYFFNAFKRNMSFVNENFDNIKKNLFCSKGELEAEFDLVLFNGKSAALIEIKYNAKPDNIEIDTLISQVEVFRILFPEYAHYNIYLGVAAMSFKKDLVWRLHRAGIATIRPVGKKMVVYDKNVKAF
ncbi:MAG: hypothetical protein FWC10_02840 [Lentimicrobiaceae bacterium]|nr:hypothetical protein [Lentimicrobiaceae bacterium]